MKYRRIKTASLDAIAVANNKMTTDELLRFNLMKENFSRLPSPMWHLNAKQRKVLLNSLARIDREPVSHGWPLDGVGI